MKALWIACIFALAAALPARAVTTAPRLIVTVSLSKHSMTMQKITRKGSKVISAWIIPVGHGTIRPGTYKLERMTEDYQSRNGNVKIKNVVRTSGHFNIRSSDIFDEWKKNGNPANKMIVLNSEDGSMLFSTIRLYGLDKTILRVIP